MPGALVGAVSCLACGSTDRRDDQCGHCAADWLAAAGPLGSHPGLLADVVRAPVGRRVLAVLLDLLVPAVLVGFAVSALLKPTPPGGLPTAAGLLALLLLVAGVLVLLRTGRSPGRLLLGLRSVDDLTGTPVRAGRVWRQVRVLAPRLRLLTADLQHGRDPSRPRLATGTGTAAQTTDRHVTGDETTPVADLPAVPGGVRDPGPDPVPGSFPGPLVERPTDTGGGRPSVGVVLESGERYDIQQVLFIGRSPVDPQPGPGRMLLAWPDLSRRVAKTHLMLEWSGTVLWVTDLESATGTAIATPDGSRLPLAPGVRFAAGIGSVISCGGRTIRVVPGA